MSGALEISLKGQIGELALDVAFAGAAGLTAITGPSGAGKTTVLRAIAGLWTPQEGRIVVGEDTLLDTRSGVLVAVHERGIGAVFQTPLLFPHLDVQRNLLYGARRDGAALSDIVGMLDIDHLLARRPANLSGGEAQRVALGRALLSKPRLLLLDEPLTGLDDVRRERLLPYLEGLRQMRDMPILYVTHRHDEIARLADRVVLMEAGRSTAVIDGSDYRSGKAGQ